MTHFVLTGEAATDFASVRDMADFQDLNGRPDVGIMLRQLFNEREAARRKVEILEMPACFACGVKVTEDCPSGLGSPCGREHKGHIGREGLRE